MTLVGCVFCTHLARAAYLGPFRPEAKLVCGRPAIAELLRLAVIG
jgi:hypothetical protein